MFLYRSALFTLLLLLSACEAQRDRLARIGTVPPVDAVAFPEETKQYTPVNWPHPDPEKASASNSLWQPGSFSFFKDRKARQVGDILRVTVKISDKAQLSNETDSSRNGTESVGNPKALGLEKFATAWLPGKVDPTKLIDFTGSNQHKGKGTIGRQETIETDVSTLVTQILPNGNLVIQGDQEIRVNAEMRKIAISGIVRPEDIGADNSIGSNQIAQARISYGGAGQLSDVQQPRVGHQILDAISPF